MKLFTAMEDYTCDSSLTCTLEELEVIETNLNNEQRVLDNAVESYMDASTALKHLVKLEGLAPHNREVYNVTMESINDQLGYPEGTVLSSEGVGSSISNFAKKVWAKIVAAWHAVRDWVRKLFGMAPIPSEKSLKKTDDIIKEAADKGPTLMIGDGGSSGSTQQEKDIANATEEEMKKAMVDIDKEMDEAAKVKGDQLAELEKKKGDQREIEAEARVIKQGYQDVVATQMSKSKEIAVIVDYKMQETYDNHETQAHYMDTNRDQVKRTAGKYEEAKKSQHPEIYDIEMGIAMSIILKAAKASTIMVTDYTTMGSKYTTDSIKEIEPFLKDPANTVMTEDKEVQTFVGSFEVGPVPGKGTTIHNVDTNHGGHYDVTYVHTGESHDQIVANHKWFKDVTDNLGSIMNRLTPEHFHDSEDGVQLTADLAADMALVGRKKIALLKNMDTNNKVVKTLMKGTNKATYRYLENNYIARNTNQKYIKGPRR